jgi:hypothetical protein
MVAETGVRKLGLESRLIAQLYVVLSMFSLIVLHQKSSPVVLKQQIFVLIRWFLPQVHLIISYRHTNTSKYVGRLLQFD